MILIETLEDIKTKFYRELRFEYVNELITEERTLKYFKSMYAKHAFDAMGAKFKSLYDNQYEYVEKLKKTYRERYGE